MELTVSIALDIILVVLMISIVYKSYRRGFLASLFNLLGTVVSYTLAAMFSRPISGWIYDSFIEERAVAAIEGKLAEVSVGGMTLDNLAGFAEIADFRDTLVRGIAGALEEVCPGLEFFSRSSSADTAASVLDQIRDGTAIAQAVADRAVEPAVINILSIGVFFVLFSVVMFVVRMLVRMGRGVNHVPLVGGLNRLAGLALGVVYAGMLGYVLSLGLALVAGLSGDAIPFLTIPILEDTHLISRLISLRLG